MANFRVAKSHLSSVRKYIKNTGLYFRDRYYGYKASRDENFLEPFAKKYWLDFSLNQIQNAAQAKELINQILPQEGNKENTSFIWDKDGTLAEVAGKKISRGGEFLLRILNGLRIKSSVLTNDHSRKRCNSFQQSLTSNFGDNIGFVSDACKPYIAKLEKEWEKQGSKNNLVIVGDSWADLLAARRFQEAHHEVQVSIVLVKPHLNKSLASWVYEIRYVLLERRLLKSFTNNGFSKITLPPVNMNGLTSIS